MTNAANGEFVVVPAVLTDGSVAYQVEGPLYQGTKLIVAAFGKRSATALARALNKHAAWLDTEEVRS